MGAKWIVVVVLCLVWVLLCAGEGFVAKRNLRDSELCEIAECNCTETAKTWKYINCTLTASQKLLIIPGSIPNNTIELSIVGGEEVIVDAYSFQMHKGFSMFRVDGARNFRIRKNGFHNLNSTAMDLQVRGCARFALENNAFKNMKTPIRADISHCKHVSIENSAFSCLQRADFQFIDLLEFEEGAFTFENQGDVGRHGPITNLSFNNVKIPKIPKATFATALAEINIHNSEITDICRDAFRASQINSIFMNNTKIQCLRSGALSYQTQIFYFVLSKCTVQVFESDAILAAVTNLTVQFSFIAEIKTGAINSSVTANIVISDNKMNTLHTSSLVFNNWDSIAMENNIIINLHPDFLKVTQNPYFNDFSFSHNEIWNVRPLAFTFMPHLQSTGKLRIKFNSNSFNHTCHCNITDWLTKLLNNSNVDYAFSSSFCTVDSILSHCFEIDKGLINMKNFTELVCGPGTYITCVPYQGETKVLNSTSTLLLDQEENDYSVYKIVIPLCVIVLLVLVVALVYKMSTCWKGRSSSLEYEYEQNEVLQAEEGIIYREDRPELTLELLTYLRQQLENSETEAEARAMIEKLYEQIIIDESNTNNNQEEETHFYEELGNMQSGLGGGEKPVENDLLQLMQKRLNDGKAALVNEYSEPTDAAVSHLYSELKNKAEDNKRASLTSNGSKMACRPLPEKPKDEAGPSSKY